MISTPKNELELLKLRLLKTSAPRGTRPSTILLVVRDKKFDKLEEDVEWSLKSAPFEKEFKFERQREGVLRSGL